VPSRPIENQARRQAAFRHRGLGVVVMRCRSWPRPVGRRDGSAHFFDHAPTQRL